jgi:hypothetical protein
MSGTAVGANLTSRFSRFPLHDNLRLVLLGIALGVPASDLHPSPLPHSAQNGSNEYPHNSTRENPHSLQVFHLAAGGTSVEDCC